MKKQTNNDLIKHLESLVKSMRDNAKTLKAGEGFARPDLQNERDASAGSMEFWALRIEEAINKLKRR